MNEESRKDLEISEENLESVSGGARVKRDGVCSLCGCNAYNRIINGEVRLVCSACGHAE